METKPKNRSVIALAGCALGAIALAIAVGHFFFGPIEQQPTIEEFIAEKTISIGEALSLSIGTRTEPVEEPEPEARFGPDEIVVASSVVSGFVALLLGLVAFIRREDMRPCGVAVGLGASALAFQVAITVLGVILAIILIGAIISAIGGG